MPDKERKWQWVTEGLIWGLFMFFIMGLIFPVLTGEHPGLKEIGVNAGIWFLGGLGYGYTMHWFRKRHGSKS